MIPLINHDSSEVAVRSWSNLPRWMWTGWWYTMVYTYHLEKWWTNGVRQWDSDGLSLIYEMENHPAMFETSNQWMTNDPSHFISNKSSIKEARRTQYRSIWPQYGNPISCQPTPPVDSLWINLDQSQPVSPLQPLASQIFRFSPAPFLQRPPPF